MKKIIKKVKGKKVLSFVLAAIMLATTFNIALPELKLNASAVDLPRDAEGNVVLDGITQKRVVSGYEATYATYANRFFGGDGRSEPTNFVIPGLSSTNDYTPQGMTYWKAKDWILISAYDATGGGKHSVIYALDGKSTEFVALFKVLNADGSVNTSHGGGIAASEYNFYYADKDSKISYVPLSEMDVEPGTVKEIKLKGSIDCKDELNGVATSYCCYDEGVLWTGNFYISSDDRYNKKAYDSNPSVLMGYKLHGNSSAEEWHYLSTNYNVVKLNSTEQRTWNNGAGVSMTYTTKYSSDYSDIEINGSITATGSLGEITADFASFTLTEGVKYKVEFISDNNLTDLYMFAPTGKHCNVKQAQTSKITQLSDGRYHYQMIFTAGLKPAGADSSWPTTQSTDDSYTGTYTMRFDQDSINGNRNFKITDLTISKYVETSGFTSDSKYEGANCAGNPTYCVVFDSVIDCIQYAMVDNGRIYISRSWSRSESTNHVRQLVVGEIDLNSPGTKTFAVNGITRACQYVDNSKMTKFGAAKADSNFETEKSKMLFMGEALCVMEGYLYMFGESAAWTYYGKDSSSVCEEPIDVIWKIDQYAIMGELRETDSEKLSHYEQVTSLDDIKNTDNPLLNTDEYIIVYESSQKDPVTQKNILYALDAFGGHNGVKLPKNNFTDTNGDGNREYDNPKGYTVGIVGHPITEYNIENGNLYLTNPEKDDVENIRWKFKGPDKLGPYQIQSASLYYAKYKDLYFNGLENFMSEDASNVRFVLDPSAPDEKWYFSVGGNEYYLWCNDGTRDFDGKINNYYSSKGFNYTEQAGTFQADGMNKLTDNGGQNVLNADIGVENYDLAQFHIYKRVLDEHAEKEMSKVYTNSTATLQPDGTYTVDMETYAISPTHYRIFDEQRPTDFILVLDASASMENNNDTGMTGYKRYSSLNKLSIESIAGSSATEKPGSVGVHGYDYSQGKIFYRTSDGAYRQIYAAVKTTDLHKTLGVSYNCTQYFWAYYKDDAGLYYVLHENGTVDSGISYDSFKSNVDNTVNASANVKNNYNSTRKETTVFTGPHYEQATLTRLDVMRSSVESLIDKISTEANTTGMKYRVAVVQYGSTSGEDYYNTGMYKNDGSFVQYSGSNSISAENYASTFFDVTDATSLQKLKYQVIANIENAEGKDADTYSNHGYEMANNIISNYSGGYDATGDRSACILMITDGIPSTGKDATDKETVANDAIYQAYQAKEKGAYSYTVQMGDSSGDWSSMGTYIEALSSEYLQAQSLTNLGEKNSDQIDYARSVAVSGFNLNELSEELFIHITANSRIGLAQLDTGSILRQTISDEFYAPTGATGAVATFHLADGYYDGLGRIAFDTETSANATYIKEVNTNYDITNAPADGKMYYDAKTETATDGTTYYDYFDITGYDYKTQYISKEHPGKKLIVRITGLLPRTNSKTDGSEITHINSSISNSNNTGIYQNGTMLAKSEEFKRFPNESFSIPEYTYVLDYGLKMLDTDVNGTLCSVSDTLSKQSTYNTITDNGAVEIAENKLDLLYSLSPDKTEESGYTLIKRDDGTYDWFKINVVPASNVYYEETKMSDGAAGKVSWSTTGSQDVANRLLPSVDDPYGWDNAYDNTSPYSNGTALSATLNSSNKNTSTKTFKFTGTGIDIVSACGRSTGVIVVNIKDSSGKRVKGYIVDTYYENGAFNGSELVSQVPVVSWSGTHGTYTVDVAAMYLSSAGAVQETIPKSGLKNKLINTGIVMNSGKPVNNDSAEEMLKNAGLEEFIAEDMEFVWFDDNSVLNGGTGVEPTKKGSRGYDPGTATLYNYIDGFRVYNPLGNNTSLYPETEKHVSYANVINHLATLEGDATELNGIAYVTTQPNGVLTFAKYQSVGPKNELYLNAGKQVSFKINVAANEKIMLGLRAVDGAVANAVITSVDDSDASNQSSHTIEEINSRTEMYYDITKCLPESVRTGGGTVKITVSNTDIDDMLAINHIKFSGAASSITGGMKPRSVSRSGDTETGVVANRFLPMTQNDLDEIQAVLAGESIPAVVKNGVVTPIVEEEEEIPGGDNNEGELPGEDDNEGDVAQNPDNGDTGNGDGSDSTESIFDIFSLLKGLIALIKKILFATVGNEHLF